VQVALQLNELLGDRTVYSDIDMIAEPLEPGFRRKDGTLY